MNPPPIIAFDLDGTLVDTAEDLVATLNVILGQEGLKPISVADGRTMVGLGAKKLIERGYEANGAPHPGAAMDGLFDRYIAHYRNHIADHSLPYPGAVAALDRLSETGWRLAICTNKPEKLSRLLIERLGIADRFRAICGADSFPVRKPHPDHLLGTIARAGGDPKRAVMVGDSITDIETARAAAIPVVAVDFGYSAVPIRTLGADRVISHFDALDAALSELSGTRPG